MQVDMYDNPYYVLFPLNYIAKNYVLTCSINSINFKSEDYLTYSLGGVKGRSKSHHQISIIQIIQITSSDRGKARKHD